MDLEIQQRVKDLTEKYGAENIVVVLGGAEAEAAGLSAETVTAGEADPKVYDEQCGMMEMVLDVDEIIKEVKTVRDQYCKFL